MVVGLEVHVQLRTRTKLFCNCSAQFGEPPNRNTCPVCLALPGSLPVLNEAAVELASRAALALGAKVQEESIFARKNYFYPDLPKGYQISQFEEPFSTKGHLDIEVDGQTKRVGITRAHMEEDAGKNLHGMGGDSVVDLNRAGVPLCEVVTLPDLHSADEAADYMRALHRLVRYLGVSEGDMEKGQMRCDANVSLRRRGEDRLGTRTELKNINSFRYVKNAIEHEIARQAPLERQVRHAKGTVLIGAVAIPYVVGALAHAPGHLTRPSVRDLTV
jgi:aspartyl-tRNA(Asn)/glutamyl-tRNA(Gln) amidotransferase subunit B